MSSIKTLIGERGVGTAPKFSEKEWQKLWRQSKLLWTIVEETTLSAHVVCHNNLVVIHNNALVYHVSPPKAGHTIAPP